MDEQPNPNVAAFTLLRGFLTDRAAPLDVVEALDGLERRYELGRRISLERQKNWRADRARLAELESR